MAMLYLQIVADLADDSQVGLVTFSGHADIYLPLTRVFDKAEIQRKIQATPRPDPRGKTNIADALRVRSWLFRWQVPANGTVKESLFRFPVVGVDYSTVQYICNDVTLEVWW